MPRRGRHGAVLRAKHAVQHRKGRVVLDPARPHRAEVERAAPLATDRERGCAGAIEDAHPLKGVVQHEQATIRGHIDVTNASDDRGGGAVDRPDRVRRDQRTASRGELVQRGPATRGRVAADHDRRSAVPQIVRVRVDTRLLGVTDGGRQEQPDQRPAE